VKQPLPAVILSADIAQLYQEMIREELNVKACTIDATLASKVRAVCKPNARLLGKKFGKDMQTVINEAKAGAFVIQPDGSVLVAGVYTLAGDEFVIDYEKGDVPFDVAIDGGLIVALDDTLTDELRLEGDARDLIRTIQEARKTADYRMDDRITLSVTAAHDGAAAEQAFASDVATLLAQYGEMIASETLATLGDTLDNADVTEEVELEMVGRVVCRVKR
jgi:isoleucyl-tRNA synthetase